MKAALALALVTVCATAVAGASAETYANFDVYRVDARGHVIDLTSNPALDTAPSPSPDGSRIAFVSSRSGSPEIYVMSASGGAPTRLTTSPFDDQKVAWNDAGRTSIAWSPDEKTIAFDVQNATYPPTCQTNCVTWSVYIVNADGTGLHSIATEARAPSWSRDGLLLAYEDLVTPYGESLGIAIDFINGTRARLKAYNADSSFGPKWSPRRDELAFQASGSVYTVGRNGSGRHRLTRGLNPTWSPDGTALAFVRGGVVLRMTRTGTRIKRVAIAGKTAALPAWSPGGRAVAVLTTPATGPLQLAVVPSGGGRLQRLAAAARFDSGPFWLGRTGLLVVAACRSACTS
jgi:Tol biopolymer transport system component